MAVLHEASYRRQFLRAPGPPEEENPARTKSSSEMGDYIGPVVDLHAWPFRLIEN
jgi:hypothetical protein